MWEGGLDLSVEILRQIWPDWQIEGDPIGKGSFGKVYRAVRRDHGLESYAAIKVMSITADSTELASLRSEGLNMNATRTYLEGILTDFVNEIQLMESLKGIQNIVSVEDYKVVEKSGEVGWDIYIRMELLTPFNEYLGNRRMSEQEIIKLGCDICTALEICGQRNIIHRDIKPENIFINNFGHFKLGDFGIARKMENITGGLSQKGTFNYMAPEVVNSHYYDNRADIYSLGLVLYRLLNANRLPFLFTEQQLMSPSERRNAINRRLRGEPLPEPCEASAAMADLVLRACSPDPARRFATASEMKWALVSVANGTYKMSGGNCSDTVAVRSPLGNAASNGYGGAAYPAPNQSQNPTPGQIGNQAVGSFGEEPKKGGRSSLVTGLLVAAIVIGIGVIAGVSIFAVPRMLEGNSGSEQTAAVSISQAGEEQLADSTEAATVEEAQDQVQKAATGGTVQMEESDGSEFVNQNKDTKNKKREAEAETKKEETEAEAKAEAKAEAQAGADTASEESDTKADVPENYGTYKLSNTDYLTLRSSPTMNDRNNKILQIPANSEVTVLEVGCNGYWKVDYKGTVGYVLPTYLAPCKGAVSVKKICDYKVITDYVTLRDIPSTEGDERTKITTGAIVEYYDSADNGFVLVSYNGQMGFILKSYQGETLIEKVN